MQFQTGMIVRSRKGHDKGQFYVVTQISHGFVFVTDAAGRSLIHPKKKNPIHLAPTKTVLDMKPMPSDSEIRRLLSAFYDRVSLPKEVL